MLTGIPLLHYFKNKNEYSGAHHGMRYLFSPGKRKVAAEDGPEKEEAILTVTIWPDPWALERTDPALRRVTVFPLSQDGIEAAKSLLADTYEQDRSFWENRPGILDCEPWYPAPAEEVAE